MAWKSRKALLSKECGSFARTLKVRSIWLGRLGGLLCAGVLGGVFLGVLYLIGLARLMMLTSERIPDFAQVHADALNPGDHLIFLPVQLGPLAVKLRHFQVSLPVDASDSPV